MPPVSPEGPWRHEVGTLFAIESRIPPDAGIGKALFAVNSLCCRGTPGKADTAQEPIRLNMRGDSLFSERQAIQWPDIVP